MASDTAANWAMVSASPRTRSSRPQDVTAAVICSLVSSPKPLPRAFTRVFRRWLKAARMVRNSNASSCTSAGGVCRRRSRITEDTTLGAGMKQWGGTSNSSWVSAYHCTSRVNAP